MTVRFGTPQDLPELTDLVRAAHIESRFAWMSFNARSTWRFLEGRLTQTGACVLVAHREDELIGGLLADTHTHWFSGTRYILLRALYIRPQFRGGIAAMKMLHGLRQWAANTNAAELRIEETFLEPSASLEKILKRLGYQTTGTVWSTWVNS